MPFAYILGKGEPFEEVSEEIANTYAFHNV
jgi:hypothetical protein